MKWADLTPLATEFRESLKEEYTKCQKRWIGLLETMRAFRFEAAKETIVKWDQEGIFEDGQAEILVARIDTIAASNPDAIP